MKFVCTSLFLLLLLGAGGCAQLCPEAKQPLLPEQDAFIQGVDAFRSGQGTQALKAVTTQYPDSVWSARAAFLVELQRRSEAAAADVTHQQERAAQRTERIAELEERVAEQDTRIERFSQDNRELAETIEQLKGLLIELEQQPQ